MPVTSMTVTPTTAGWTGVGRPHGATNTCLAAAAAGATQTEHRVNPVPADGVPTGNHTLCRAGASSATATVDPRYPVGIVQEIRAISQFPSVFATAHDRLIAGGVGTSLPVKMCRVAVHVLTTCGPPTGGGGGGGG